MATEYVLEEFDGGKLKSQMVVRFSVNGRTEISINDTGLSAHIINLSLEQTRRLKQHLAYILEEH